MAHNADQVGLRQATGWLIKKGNNNKNRQQLGVATTITTSI